jgi:hypothetical protein
MARGVIAQRHKYLQYCITTAIYNGYINYIFTFNVGPGGNEGLDSVDIALGRGLSKQCAASIGLVNNCSETEYKQS